MTSLFVPAGWVAFAAIPLAAVLGLVLRSIRVAPFKLRMRPHYVLGYFVVSVVRQHHTACPEPCPVRSWATTPPAGE